MGSAGSDLAVLAGLLVGAAALHLGLARLERRLPLRIARRAGAPRPDPSLQRRAALLVLPLKLGVWLAALALASEWVAALRIERAVALAILRHALEATLFTLEDRAISVRSLLELGALLAGLWLGVGLVVRVLRTRIAALSGGQRGVEESVAIVTRLALSFLGAVVVLQAWGIDLRSLAFVASVLGVGIGFGLQNLANNFVSGIVIGLEHPVQPGDFVQVGEHLGTVKRVGGRCTEIETLDRTTVLVPNAQLLEREVVNYSHGDPVVRLRIPVGVAYGSDLASTRRALLDAVRDHRSVLADPRPDVRLTGFGESSVDFEVLVHTREPRRLPALRSDLLFRIEAALRRAKVSIPFPQRDLHLRSPELLQAVRAWSARTFGAEELAAASDAAVPAPAPANGAAGTDVDPTPGALDLEGLVVRMRGPGGVRIADRRHRLRLYPRCFVGREAVDWLVSEEGLTRSEAGEVGQLLVDHGLAHHVLDEHGFRDGAFFYRFRADETAAEADPMPAHAAAR